MVWTGEGYGVSRVRKRHVFFIHGYEPQGVDGFYRMFAREWRRFRTTWPVKGSMEKLSIVSDDVASWDLETSGPDWNVSTRYEFLRLEGITRNNLAQPLWLQLGRALRWMSDDIFSGALAKVFRASGKMGVLLLYSEVLLLLWISLPIIAGVSFGSSELVWGIPFLANLALSTAIAIAIFALLKPLADRIFVNQLNNCWPHMREFARGAPSGFDHSVDVFAKRIVAAAQARDADEILIVGHSAGAMLGLSVVARALDLDPGFARVKAPVVLLTVGSIMPTMALHPAANKLREIIRRVAIESSLLWVDCQSKEDFMNYQNFDPVEGVGLKPASQRCNPVIRQIPIRDMISPETFSRVRWNFFRMHYQYIMSNDRRASYDYYMFVCGPAPVSDWAAKPDETLASFTPQAAYLPKGGLPDRVARRAG